MPVRHNLFEVFVCHSDLGKVALDLSGISLLMLFSNPNRTVCGKELSQ